MIFAHPEILYFLGLLVIPIIIHFFHFRRKRKVYFSDVTFLKNVQEEKRSQRNLKHWLLLLIRLLAITSIVLAFAQPFVPLNSESKATGNTVQAFFIDNSFSMMAEGTKGQLLESAKKEVLDVSQSLNATDELFLITNDFNPEHTRVQDIRSFQDAIAGIQNSAASAKFSEVNTMMLDVINQREEETQTNLFVFSDFQKSQFDFNALEINDNVVYNFIIKEAEKKSNLYIDSIWVEDPVIKIGQPLPITFRLVNASDQALNDIPVYLDVNESAKGVANVSVGAQSSINDQITFVPKTSGFAKIKIYVEDEDVTFDDAFYGVVPIKEQVKVLLVNSNDESDAFERLYKLDNYYNVEKVDIGQINVDFNTFDLVIFSDIKQFPKGLVDPIQNFMDNGGHVVVTPDSEADLSSINQLMTSLKGPNVSSLSKIQLPLEQIDYDNPFFENIFETKEVISMPSIEEYFPTSSVGNAYTTSLLNIKNGSPFITMLRYGQGRLYWQAAPNNVNGNKWSKHALFSAIYLRIAERSVEKFPLYYTLGSNQNIIITKNTSPDQSQLLSLTKNNQELLTTELQKYNGKNIMRIGFDDFSSIQEEGFYKINADNQDIQNIALNYSRQESVMEFYNAKEISSLAKENGLNVGQIIQTSEDSNPSINTKSKKEYWRILLFLALGFLILEIVINRLWKTT